MPTSKSRVNEETMDFLNKVLAESDEKCDSLQELLQLYDVFKELLQQGKAMGIDYYDEMSHVCRMKIANQVVKLKDFFIYTEKSL